MNRRDWLTKTSLALAGGLVLGDAVMEQYERLTHKKVWALGGTREGYWPFTDHTGRIIWLRKSFLVPPPVRLHDYISLANIYPNV